MKIGDNLGDPLYFQRPYRLSKSHFVPKIRTVKVAVKLRKTQNVRRVGENSGPIFSR